MWPSCAWEIMRKPAAKTSIVQTSIFQAVSYTHLDVYKRQVTALSAGTASIIVTLENKLSATLFLTVLSPSSSGPTIDMGDFTAWNQICDWYMIVINKDNAIPEDYNPQITTYQSIQIDQRVLPHLQEMMDAASALSLIHI